jgi:hypothetical protein
MNQQAKDRMSQLLGKTPEDGRPKMKVENKIMGTTHNLTTKCCYLCEEEGHISRDCLKKQERFPTTIVEYEESELRDLLALERPKRRKTTAKCYARIAGNLDIMRGNVQNQTCKGEQIWSLVRNATKRDTMQGDAKRKALQDFRKWDN